MTRKLYVVFLMLIIFWEIDGKSSEERTQETRGVKSDATALIFADEFKQTIERYLFGICPQPYKARWLQMPLGNKTKNGTTFTCDLDTDQQDLAGRLATLSLRAHSASRSDCLRLGAVLANTLGELARTAASRQIYLSTSAAETKKRKLSKSQKMQIKAKQRTALAVKKKAAAAAAAAAAKVAS
ncbi:uncharacterized protein LOC119838935 isoform X1 [Zerene cesonia]|uniref:uncharacterized protein LOC119838935 isoform X1 n=1 Tax=Zerene cesonia TaxID=33412 RepID=UPI0018E4E815|nr:uncharacterized protein LOC119838935 isoform X1 [Zerene cesonia]